MKILTYLDYLRAGWKRKDIADELGVTLRTIYNWDKKIRDEYDSVTRAMCYHCKLRSRGREAPIKPRTRESYQKLRAEVMEALKNTSFYEESIRGLWGENME